MWKDMVCLWREIGAMVELWNLFLRKLNRGRILVNDGFVDNSVFQASFIVVCEARIRVVGL